MEETISREAEESVQAFLFDDFFSGQDDPGVEVSIYVRGKQVPIRLKRGLSLAEREEAKNAAITRRIRPDGQMEILAINEAKLQVETLIRAVKSWPFTKDGQPVPITRENLLALGSDVADAILLEVTRLAQVREEALVPFAPPSDAA
jgi:hypothetical protein